MMTERQIVAAGLVAAVLCWPAVEVSAQQTAVPRIEQMPRMPAPYLMRNWKQVALGYDSLVFDRSLVGEHLPLVFLETSTINYPAEPSFGLHSYVGDGRTEGEAINVLPAVVGATLCGVDKTAQNGRNWVRMCQEYFNNRPEEYVYLNAPAASSGDDWWYDVMPNVFFYQLYAFHPSEGDFQRQFRLVADRWLAAVFAMGGSLTPWSHPGLYHRGWYLATMTPNNETPPEPEAGGSIGWLLYNAWVVTGTPDYRYGAELCLEELNAYTMNPAYELQLPYGALLAARMNAELGTQFNVEKMVNWCFDVSPLRSWGAIVGRWGGYDCSGLIGEVNGSNDYAFAMNTFEQVGALAPLVRYDSRFARAIGKWVLNAANASRLFYPNFLPDANQDSRAWSSVHDPSSWIAHEALRQRGPANASPYATGDAIAGGWAQTNLSLYSSSHVGLLGAIIDTTEIPGLLKLNLLATDAFHAPAYASFLYYNPDSVDRSVFLQVGDGGHDVYDAVSHAFVRRGVTGSTSLTIPADGAVVAVITPAGGSETREEERLLVDGVVLDYHAGTLPANYRPRIKGFGSTLRTVYLGGATRVYCTASDRDGDSLAYLWSAGGGTISGSGASVTWSTPPAQGVYTVACSVTDLHGGADSARMEIAVVDSPLSIPVIHELLAHPAKVDLGGQATVVCSATDPGGFPLTYRWRALHGVIEASDSSARWTAPDSAGNFFVVCEVSNTAGGTTADSVLIRVRDFSTGTSGPPVLHLQLDGNTQDVSGFNNHGTPTDVQWVADRVGAAGRAGGFNGATSNVRVPNAPSLSFDSSITVSMWAKSGLLLNREMFLVSHGSWQNRWKMSITPERRLRWTVKTTAGVRDVDSRTQLTAGTFVCATGVYDGADLEIYVNGELERIVSWSGRILTPAIDLLVGQMLPGDANYNLQGVVDEVWVYAYAMTYPQVQQLYATTVPVTEEVLPGPGGYALIGNFPNPFNGETVIRYELAGVRDVKLTVYDLLGREVTVLVDGRREPGRHSVRFDASALASGVYVYRLMAGDVTQAKRMVMLR